MKVTIIRGARIEFSKEILIRFCDLYWDIIIIDAKGEKYQKIFRVNHDTVLREIMYGKRDINPIQCLKERFLNVLEEADIKSGDIVEVLVDVEKKSPIAFSKDQEHWVDLLGIETEGNWYFSKMKIFDSLEDYISYYSRD